MKKIKYLKLNKKNFHSYKSFILKSERAYPIDMRSSEEDYLEMIETKGSQCYLMFVGKSYVGNIFSCPLDEDELQEIGINSKIAPNKILYIYNIIIDEDYQNNGFGTKLLEFIMKVAKNKKFKLLAGDFRKGAPVHLMEKKGAKKTAKIKNWDNTKEEFILCELPL